MQRSLSAPRDFLERLVLCEVESSLLKLLIGGTSTPRSASTMTAHIVSRKEGPALEVVRSVIVVRQEPRSSRPRFRPGPKEGSGTGRATVPPSARHRDFAFLELLGAATGGAFFALDGAAAFAFGARRSTPPARADRQEPLPMFRCPGSPGFRVFPDHLRVGAVFSTPPLTQPRALRHTSLSLVRHMKVSK